jgi:putative endopeptidase
VTLNIRSSSAGLLAIATILCVSSPAHAGPADLRAPSYGQWGYDLSGRDTAVRPGDDFFAYANGTYIEKTQIPPDRTWYGTVNVLRDLSEARVHAMLEHAAASAPAEPAAKDVQGKVGAFYKAFMNEAAVEALDAKPLAPDLEAIRKASDRTQLAALMGRAKKGFEPSLFDVQIFPDIKDSDHYSVYVDQGGLGMPDRDYYLEPEFAAKKQAYQAYVATMLGMIGWADAEANAKAITDFETQIAEASWTKADLRDPEKIYNPMSAAELAEMAPGFDWKGWLAPADLGSREGLVVVSKTALPKIAALYSATPLDVLKAYMAFHLADNAADALSSRFADANFDFQGRTLSGQEALPVRWKRGVRATSGALGEAIGQIYVAKYFPPESKARMLELVKNLKGAYRARIERLSWMGAETKAKALQKLAAMDVQIGYPKKWKDYSSLVVHSDDLYGNEERGIAWQWEYQLARLNKPVDRDDWSSTPQTVNAFNQGLFNQLIFPAAILQPPVFDPKADPAVNYGAIGAVIGHEMSHGFDDQGRKFDARGHLADWWSPADAQHFVKSSKSYGAQYERFPIIDGAHIKGDLTMGENIADLGGVLAAMDAYHASLHGKPARIIDGLTGDQRFFLAYAQYYRNKWRPDMTRQLLVSDPHSPDRARVDVVLPNVDAWYKAWNIKPGDKLYIAPEDRVRVW